MVKTRSGEADAKGVSSIDESPNKNTMDREYKVSYVGCGWRSAS